MNSAGLILCQPFIACKGGLLAEQVAILQRTNSFRNKFERFISKDRHNTHLRRKAYTAIAAKMARTVHAVVKGCERYRPFFEGAIDSRKIIL